MKTKSFNVLPEAGTATNYLDDVARLNFSDPQEREAHIRAFLAWLPPILHEAPHIHWERMPSNVMGYLVRNVVNNPDVVSITLATASAMDTMKNRTLYDYCHTLRKLLERLRSDYGLAHISELRQRTTWERFTTDRTLSGGELNMLKHYDTLASAHLRSYIEGLTERQQMIWSPYLLPPLPRGFLDKQAQQRTIRSAAQDRRKEQSDVVLPLFPLLVEVAQLRKQAAERLIKEFRRHKNRALAGEIELPYHFQYVDRQFSVSEHAATLAEVQLVEREVTLSFLLWDRMSWVKAHYQQYSWELRSRWRQQIKAYAPERNTYFLEYKGSPGDLLWCGDLIAEQLLGQQKGGYRFSVVRPGLLTPPISDTKWFAEARKVADGVFFEPESLYRGVVFAAALATLSLTNGSRVSELLQVSASRFETIVVDELKNQQPTGRQIGIVVQKLLPKGYAHESERQFFLISDMAIHHLKEIAKLLQEAHEGSIPVVHPGANRNKAEDLQPEPYFFQWAASEDGRLGLLSAGDVAVLLRFLFHGLTLTTKKGIPITIAPHLLRHVLATHMRTVQNIPAEALAYLLHHRVTFPGSTHALTLPEATAYYSRLPVAHLLALLFEVQSALMPDQERSYLQVPPPQTLEQKDEALRKQFERCGMIGPTVLGFCSAGTCVRPDNRGICANCPFLVPHYSNLAKAKTWLKLYELQAGLHDDQGHAVDAAQARKVIQYLKDMIRIMEIQVRTRQDGGYLPFADTLPPAQDEEGGQQ